MSEDKNKLNKDFGWKTLPYIDQLYSYLLLITGDESKAEKILVKGYEKAAWFYQNLSKETDIQLWMFRIVMKIVRDELHSIKDNSETLTEQGRFNFEVINNKLNEQKPGFVFTKKMINTISSLSLKMKEILILINHLKFSFETTANLIDLPVGIIKKILFDSRKLFLIKLLDESGKPESKEEIISFEDKKLITAFIEQNNENIPDERIVEKFKDEIEVQNHAKTLIETNLLAQTLREAVKFKVIKRFAPELKNQISSKNKKEKKGLVTGATIAMFILIAIMMFINKPTVLTQQEIATEQTGENNLFIQLKDNFFKLNKGVFNNDFFFGNPDSLKIFLTSLKIMYEPQIFNYKNWKIEACFMTKVNGNQLANYIYKSENRLLYISQIPITLIDSQSLKLSENLLDFLNKGKCFISRDDDNIYLLRKIGDNIFGYASKSLNNDFILNICQ